MKTKRLLIGLFSLLAVVCMAFSVVMLNNSKTAGAVEYTVETTDEGNFTIADGASVRTKKLHPGLRFTAKISESFYNEMTEKDAKWGALIAIDQADNSQVTLANVSADIIDATWDRLTVSGNKVPGDIEPFVGADGYEYSLVINLTEEEYKLNLCVRGYVTYEEGGVNYVIYTDANDNNRNIIDVAENVLLADALDAGVYQEDEMAAAREILKNYINAQYRLTSVTKLGYIEDFSLATDDTLIVNVPDGDYALTVEGNSFDVTVVEGKATLNGTANNALNLTIGNSYIAKLVGDAGNYAQKIRFVNKAIATEDELVDMMLYYDYDQASNMWNFVDPATDANLYYNGETFEQRLYVLANNITMQMLTGAFYDECIYVGNRAFFDTLDGQGYTIKGYTNWVGLFATVGGQATIKNIALEMTSAGNDANPSNRSIVSQRVGSEANFENVYMSFHWSAYNEESGMTAAQNFNVFGMDTYYSEEKIEGTDKDKYPYGFNVTNTYVYFDDTIDVLENGTSYDDGYFMAGTNLWGGGYTLDNMVVVSSKMNTAVHSDRHFVAGNTTLPACQHLTYGKVTLDKTAEDFQEKIPTYLYRDAHNAYVRALDDNGEYVEGVTSETQLYAVTDTVEKAWDNSATAGLKHYATPGELLATTQSIGNWTINADGTATWNVKVDNSEVAEYAQSNTAAESYAETIAITDVAYLEDFTATGVKNFSLIGVPNGNYQASINGSAEVAVTVANGVFSISALPSALTLGETYTGKLVAEDGTVYLQNFKYVSKVITTAAEFEEMATYYATETADKYYDGATFTPRYYVLGADLVGDEKVNYNTDKTYILKDIFDGQGHTVRADIYWNGIFGDVYGTIKNASFNVFGCWNTNQIQERSLLARRLRDDSVVQNVAIRLVGSYTTNMSIPGSFSGLAYDKRNAVTENIYINTGNAHIRTQEEYTTGGLVTATGTYNETYFYYGYLSGSAWQFGGVDGIYVVSQIPYAVHYSGETSVAEKDQRRTFIASNDVGKVDKPGVNQGTVNGLYRYATVAEMTQEVTMVGNWAINSDGTATWVNNTFAMAMKVGDALEADADIQYNVEGDAVVAVDGYIVAKKAGTAILTAVGEEGAYVITVVDNLEGFTAVATNDTLTVDGNTTITVSDANGKTYVGNVAYALSADGVVSIAEDGTITGVAAGEVTVFVAIHVHGIVKVLAVDITVA